jgi:lysozyme
MKVNPAYIAIGGAAALILLMASSFKTRLINVLSVFIPDVESYSAKAYWDVSRYSWGYGTAAPGKDAVTNRENAFTEMVDHLFNDYADLKNRVTRKLNVNQWAALLSFSYNLGIGNAHNLLININSGNDTALETQWKKYIYVGGMVNQNLVERRDKEWNLWLS